MSSPHAPDAREGALLLVGTPIGNLGDITLRALDALRSVSVVAAEDTRRTRQLLAHFEIHGCRLIALPAHAPDADLARVLGLVAAGARVAFVTDAGMPSVSDPGARLVRAVVEAGLPLECFPGPSAVPTAVALSGLVDGPFWFAGFLPRRGEGRAELLERIARSPEPVVLFEAATRLQATLAELAAWAPSRQACVARELTKLHEELARGALTALATREDWRGEAVVVLAGVAAGDAPARDAISDDELEARARAGLAEGRPSKGLAAELAAWSGRPRRELYALLQRWRLEPGSRSQRDTQVEAPPESGDRRG